MLKILRRSAGKTNDPFCGINLGDKVRDMLTDFTGVVLGRSEHITGCNQVFVLPSSEKQNEIKDGHWFDIERIELIEAGAIKVSERLGGADIPPPAASGRR